MLSTPKRPTICSLEDHGYTVKRPSHLLIVSAWKQYEVHVNRVSVPKKWSSLFEDGLLRWARRGWQIDSSQTSRYPSVDVEGTSKATSLDLVTLPTPPQIEKDHRNKASPTTSGHAMEIISLRKFVWQTGGWPTFYDGLQCQALHWVWAP